MSDLLTSQSVAVTYRDGRSDTIAIGELSLRQLYTFIKLLGGQDTPALVALCAGKPVEWVDSLTDESFDRLAEAAHRANFQRAVARAHSDPIAAAALAPLAQGLAAAFRPTPGSSGPATLKEPAA